MFISLNYKSKTMKSYCQEIKSKFNIKFLVEKKPLGTIGSLKLLKITMINQSSLQTAI